MPRIGKKPISVPTGVEAKIAGQVVTIKGPKGTMTVELHPWVAVAQAEGQLNVTVARVDEKQGRSLWGLSRVLLNNAVLGVTNGFSKKLEITGVGFRAAVAGRSLNLNVGFSHPVEYKFPEGIEIKVEKNTITVTGIDKQLVGQVAAQIRDIKKPEPYKGKGIKYSGEVIRRKAGKVVKTAGAG
ncbi:MAG: 50S ribosomal protein L6 [Patescibacteria group bacterium]|jgi:large subunit ribosomal protein L6